MDDLHNCINPRVAIAPAAAAVADNTAQVGAWIDRQGFDSVEYLIITGTLADADATFAVTMDHADLADHSDAAAVAATDVLGDLATAGFTFANDGVCRKVGYVGGKRYTRLTITPTNNAAAAPMAAIALLGDPDLAPTDNPPT